MHLAPQEGLAPEFRRLHAGGRAEPKQVRKKLAGNALYHKNEERFFSDSLAFLADPEYEPPTPSPKKRARPRKKVSQPPAEPEAAASRASPPRQEGAERPAPESSPLQASRHARTPAPSPPNRTSKNLSDFAGFWNEAEEEED